MISLPNEILEIVWIYALCCENWWSILRVNHHAYRVVGQYVLTNNRKKHYQIDILSRLFAPNAPLRSTMIKARTMWSDRHWLRGSAMYRCEPSGVVWVYFYHNDSFHVGDGHGCRLEYKNRLKLHVGKAYCNDNHCASFVEQVSKNSFFFSGRN
jgi:hypothetical protein